MKPIKCGAKPKRYPSDLTCTRWKRLKRLLPPAKPGGRPREVNLREVLNGIFYIARRLCLADNAQGFAPLEHLLSLLPRLADRRHLVDDQ